MFELAIAIGIYSYLILILGLIGKLSFFPVALVSVLLWGFVLIVKIRKGIEVEWGRVKKIFKSKLVLLLLFILFIQGIISLIGALGPELSFDALWYHLTLPKLYVNGRWVLHVPGGLLYYSSMPRLTEMLYTAALIFRDEILAKLIHWLFGILSAIALFKLLRRYFNDKFSFLGTTIFYTLLVVGWQSTTAYVDLTRTFFELLALTYFLRWLEEKGNWLLKSGLMMGLSLSTKYLSLESLLIFLVLIIIFSQKRIKNTLQFLGVSLGLALPWYFLAYVNTGNPFYPLFSGWFQTHQIGEWGMFFSSHNPLAFFISFWQTTFHLDNLLTPVFLIFLPLVLFKIWQQNRLTKIVALYFFLGYILWFLTPPSSARYLLPFIPALIFVSMRVLMSSNKIIQKVAISAILLACFFNLGSRIIATQKFLPVVLGKQTKNEFLSQRLNFDYGDFYDVDGFFKENVKEKDLVLIYNIHNLYYVDFPFVHQSWAKPGTYFTHILVKEIDLPEQYGDLELLYENEKTKVKLYRYGDFY